MATWKKILVEGLDLTGSDVTNNQKDLVVGQGLSLNGTAATEALSQESNNILLGADGDVTIAIDIAGQTDLGSGVVGGDLLLVADVNDSNKIKKTSVADIVGAVSTGVTSITSGNGLTSLSSAQGAVTINLDTSTLGTETVTSATEFIVSNSDTEGVAAASAISLGVFSNATTAFIDLTDLSVSVGSAGTANLAYDNTTGVFTYTPPDLSSYQTISGDVHATSFAYVGGTSAGPTGTLTLSDSSTVAFGAIPSASSSASGIVTNAAQTFGGNKTFANNVIITGDLTVNGTNTILNTETLTVDDDIIVINDNAATISAQGGIQLKTTATNTAQLLWNAASGTRLTGWLASPSGTATNLNNYLSVMEFVDISSATNPTGNAGGVGSFHLNTADSELYIRVA